MTDIGKKYIKMTQIEHILKRPGMYIGGVEEIDRDNWVFENDKIVYKTIRYSPGLFKIFDEIVVNAYDQTVRDSTVRNIKVDIDTKDNEITIYNDGKGIDVVLHPKEKIYVPELIFGHLLTSTSFAEDIVRTTGGIHGLGAKLTAVFSTYFKIEVGDPINKKSFSQYYRDNLSFKSKPVIKDYNKPNGYVKITYRPDLKYFKIDSINEDTISLMKRRVYDIGALTRDNVKVYLDGGRLDIKNLGSYVSMVTDRPQYELKCDKDSLNYDENRWKIIVTQSDGEFKQISFVNGIDTINGGFHVDYIVNAVTKKIKEYIGKKFKTDKIKDRFIKNNLWVFISSVIENPTFSSQTKDELMTPVNRFGSECIVTDRSIEKIYMAKGFDDLIKNQIDVLQKMDIKSLTVKKRSGIASIPKLYDANYAGTKKSSECTLILTEGDSAKTMAVTGLSTIPKANDYYGVFPLKGKLINVRDVSHQRIIKNEEFVNLKNIIGLTVGKRYDRDSVNELRYGKIMLMMDADVDGSHIKGLFINMIHHYWPSLLEIDGFIEIFITPIVKAVYRGKTEIFYNLDRYDRWKDDQEKRDKIDVWKIKYYKGLGTNTSDEAKEYFKNLDDHVVKMKWDDKSSEAIELGFSKERSGDRKLWLKRYDPKEQIDHSVKSLTYHNFIHKELIHFSNSDNIRSVPNVIDGLKPSQRKVLYSAFKRNLNNEIKVAQFVGYVSEITSYHHGETSLANTIVNMAQDFVGANNLNLLEPKGQFGTRLMGGKDHSSPRYIYTQLNKITRHIFRKEDDDILDYLNDDGMDIEPSFYVPIVPMILVNGAEGIGTGYSTYVPKYNIIDIIDNLKGRLNGGKFIQMDPWYRGFKGKVVKVSKDLYYSKGRYDVDRNRKLIFIKELPIGTWTDRYREQITSMSNDEQFIKGVKHNSTESDVDITIRVDNEETIDELILKIDKYTDNLEKRFSLVSTLNLSNMHAYTVMSKNYIKNDSKSSDEPHNLMIKKFATPIEIMEEYYKIRLMYYEKRKEYILNKLQIELNIIKSKIKFIEAIIDNKIKIFNVPEKSLIGTLVKQKLHKMNDDSPYDYLIKMPISTFTKEKIDELTKNRRDRESRYNEIKNKSIQQLWLDDLDELEKVLKI